jgi:hypothetical protein
MASQLKELRENLELLPITELRKKASANFGIRLNREDTKEDIIDKIVGVASKADYAQTAKTDVPLPGWARIKCHPVPGKPTFPFYVGVNGYFIWIPYNVEVDVPIKILGVLNDAQENRITTDEFGNKKHSLEMSYPYSLLARTEGPDPRPGFEVGHERKIKAKREFAAREGYWPKSKDIAEARQAAMLRNALHPTE